MNIVTTLKDIKQIPEYVREIWYMVRDNGIDESVAHSRQTLHDKTILEKMDALTKKQDDMWSLLATRFNKIDDKVERLTVNIYEIHDAIVNGNDVVPQSSKQSEMASKTEIIEILRGHFDEISIDLDHHDITCSSEDAITSLQTEVEDLSTQVQDVRNTMNDGFNEVREMLKNKNVLINPGESVIVSMFGTPKDN
jgi:predicted  nucleic acid-binding Zn-ribbon protein